MDILRERITDPWGYLRSCLPRIPNTLFSFPQACNSGQHPPPHRAHSSMTIFLSPHLTQPNLAFSATPQLQSPASGPSPLGLFTMLSENLEGLHSLCTVRLDSVTPRPLLLGMETGQACGSACPNAARVSTGWVWSRRVTLPVPPLSLEEVQNRN